ncbi:hypothetical protein [Marinigracilibium pacificum]|uniref:Uncharacterized protein n=1 Tax=Marinigracilibium pacificum TaxID=2729599 RepID=A0A848J228_9BACT|nr:hypothetical protein [Marinigracilibium pacificum]NMM47252.1 hypothetical protein [Marinigracilibium pacificum]
MQRKDGFTTKRKIGGVIFHFYSDAAEFYDKHSASFSINCDKICEDLAEELLYDINPTNPLISKGEIRKAISLLAHY